MTGRAVARALRAAGCSQVLRLITTATGTGGPYTGLVDIFNLASGAAAYQAARAFGEQWPYAPLTPPVPNTAPAGFILPWPGTAAAGVARASGNAAEVMAYGHFLAVLWTYGSGDSVMINGLIEFSLAQFADNRVGALPPQ